MFQNTLLIKVLSCFKVTTEGGISVLLWQHLPTVEAQPYSHSPAPLIISFQMYIHFKCTVNFCWHCPCQYVITKKKKSALCLCKYASSDVAFLCLIQLLHPNKILWFGSRLKLHSDACKPTWITADAGLYKWVRESLHSNMGVLRKKGNAFDQILLLLGWSCQRYLPTVLTTTTRWRPDTSHHPR